ncbi:hypothetical protein AB0J80_36215 [Actinoplanes sp. NPDC049548]|uniref:hypothetical protein n=1 Tax=Actinoplanes sp. NPDC049548 TaxID=3155152 RepID=UPI00343580E9
MSVRPGYYLGGNADIRADAATIGNVRAITQYRSLADANLLPGWKADWINQLDRDTLLNVVVELKHYGAKLGPQKLNDRTVPAPSMLIQRRDGKGVPAYGYDQVTSGQLDPLLDRLLTQLRAMPHPEMINLQVASEFDTDHEFGTTDCGRTYTWAESDTRAVRAVKYMISYLLDAGLPQGVTFSVGMGGFDRAAFRRMHPASLAPLVDRLQWNAYNHGSHRDPYAVLNRTKVWAVADLDPRWLRKPAIIAEYGTAASLGSQAAWLAGIPTAVDRMQSEGGPHLEALIYFNSNPEWATLTPKADGLAALSRAYRMAPLAADLRPVACNHAR